MQEHVAALCRSGCGDGLGQDQFEADDERVQCKPGRRADDDLVKGVERSASCDKNRRIRPKQR